MRKDGWVIVGFIIIGIASIYINCFVIKHSYQKVERVGDLIVWKVVMK